MSMPRYDGEIVAIRVRVNWRGKPVLQVQRQRWQCGWPRWDALNGESSGDRKCGLSIFRDARRSDVWDVTSFLQGGAKP